LHPSLFIQYIKMQENFELEQDLDKNYGNYEANNGPMEIKELPKVVDVPDQPCQQLYEGNPVLLGFDVVQYHFIPSFRDGGIAVRGKPEYAYNFRGYQFWFSSLENRNLFINNPWRYAPAWGGFCSWGVALELPPRWPWQIDFLGPPASPWQGWFIVDDVLMFNIWADYTSRFLQNRDDNLRKAAERWKSLFSSQMTLEVGPFNTHCIGHGLLKNWCLSQQPSPWLQPLPECNIITNTTTTTNNNSTIYNNTINENNNKTTTTTIVTGGGIVSDVNSFYEFSNSSISPYAIRAITIGSIVGGILLFLLMAVSVWKRKQLAKMIKTKCFCFKKKP